VRGTPFFFAVLSRDRGERTDGTTVATKKAQAGRKKAPAGKRKARAGRKRNQRKPDRRRVGRWLGQLALLGAGVLVAYVGFAFVVLDHRVRSEFGQTQWRVPAHVYTQPLELYGGRELTAAVLADHLRAVGYRATRDPDEAGEFARRGQQFLIEARAFRAADAREPARRLEVRFADGRVARVRDAAGNATIGRIEPERMASIFPGRAADRVLLQLDEVPDVVVDAVIAVEDQRFFDHLGVRPLAIARAAVANLRAGRIVQGGSTITQQLAKNFYLSGEQRLGRKFNEALMALSLEWHFSKEEILEAYLNEVYLGQEGARSINGFGLGARFWFNRPLDELELHQVALLVGMIRGPAYLDPRDHPERARRRRPGGGRGRRRATRAGTPARRDASRGGPPDRLSGLRRPGSTSAGA